MRYIQQSRIKPGLPLDWDQTVASAKKGVAKKMRDARAKAKKDGKSRKETHILMLDARKKAINSRSKVWRKLKQHLSEASFGKCWYCQSIEIRSLNPVDHFKPKGGVKECAGHPGYWWLAFSWKNYRYSCGYCNSSHENGRHGGGKQDHFDLVKRKNRQFTKGQANQEIPMLLDPCRFGDSKLITYDTKRARVIANESRCKRENNIAEKAFDRVKYSIDTYDFNHEPLRRKRETMFDDIKQLIVDINFFIKKGVDEHSEEIRTKQAQLVEYIRFDSQKYGFNEAAYCYLSSHSKKNAWIEDILEEAR
ncbi:hypothetical protein L4D08_18030 [Photobacterium chitinilyticum]|uniref:hypothetical protein n=1 Tax=Photobacterium chitinilyticum TaxID=2485123 RepID=UPI003D1276AF